MTTFADSYSVMAAMARPEITNMIELLQAELDAYSGNPETDTENASQFVNNCRDILKNYLVESLEKVLMTDQTLQNLFDKIKTFLHIE